MNDLIVFLNARLDEDEAIAEVAGGSAPQGVWAQVDPDRRPGRIDCDSGYVVTYDEGSPDDGQAAHIARHDPARALREVEAKRRIVFMASRLPALTRDFDLFDNNRDGWADALRHLAAVYSDHPDYRADWKP